MMGRLAIFVVAAVLGATVLYGAWGRKSFQAPKPDKSGFHGAAPAVLAASRAGAAERSDVR